MFSTTSLKFGDSAPAVEKKVRTRNGFLLTDFVGGKRTKYCV